MCYLTRAYDNEAGQPVVVLVVEGTHDVSRLVNLFHHGNTEQIEVGHKIVRKVRRHNGGREALRLLLAHGGLNFTEGFDLDPQPVPGGETVTVDKEWFERAMEIGVPFGVSD